MTGAGDADLADIADVADVGIVGAGPAGSIAAARLAAQGARVLIFDPSHPREKPCGGGISAAARRAFPEIDALASLGKSGTRLRVQSPSGREISVSGQGATFAIDRALLDARLLENAVAAGTRHIAERVMDVVKGRTAWEIHTPARRFRVRSLIGADGMSSVVRRRVAPPQNRTHVAIGAHVVVDGLQAPSALIRLFGDRRGFGWVFNRKDRSSIGIGMPLDRCAGWKTALADLFRREATGREMPRTMAWTLPLAVNESAFSAPMSGEDWCLVGDAAGHVDPLSGEGIRFALWGGELAAACISRGRPAEFDRLWREAYLSRFVRRASLARHLEHRYRIEGLVAAGALPFLNRRIYAALASG